MKRMEMGGGGGQRKKVQKTMVNECMTERTRAKALEQ